jgi:hypothetical protein
VRLSLDELRLHQLAVRNLTEREFAEMSCQGARRQRRGYLLSVTESLYRVSAKPPTPPDPYLLAWAKLRRRRATVWAMVLMFPVVGLAATALVDRSWMMFVIFPYLAALFVSSWMASYFECPHCGGNFAKKHAWAGDFRENFLSRCVHCGIAMGTPQSSIARTQESRPSAIDQPSPSVAGEPNPASELELHDTPPEARTGSQSN